jgi:nucleoside-diphosphate-sugar epimerase
VLALTGKDGSIVHVDPLPGDIREFDVDNTRICQDLGLRFERDFEKGLRQTLEWAVAAFRSGLIA